MTLKRQSKEGPNIKASFRIGEKGIAAVDIQPHHAGFEWEITENEGSQKVADLLEEWLSSYCAKQPSNRLLPLDMQALPPYTSKVLLYLQQVPFGSTLSYKQLAEATGKPKGARAVGNACGRNPFPLIVPCHRVLASHNALGGFSCGIEIKKVLLAFEGRED